MLKKTLARNKILFFTVVAFIFLIALGIILLLIFVNEKQNIPPEKTLQEKVSEQLGIRVENPIPIDLEMIHKLLSATTTKKNVQIDEQEVLNLLNQKINK